MAEGFKEPEISDEISARAEIEQKNELVALNDSDGVWKLELGAGFHTQW